MSKSDPDSRAYSRLKPIKLYDHLPGILAGYPAVLFLFLGLASLPAEFYPSESGRDYWFERAFDTHMLFWIGVTVMIVWYIAFRFNLPKGRFWMAFGLLGTFVGIPVVLEMTGQVEVFHWMGEKLGQLKPEINASAWFVFATIFFFIWLSNFIWSRTHMRVTIDESGLTINRMGGKGERFDLIGLKTENEPLDYLELFIGGIGKLSLKTRMGKPIFTMKRVYGLYRIPLFPFFKSKLKRIEEMLSYQGKVMTVDPSERLDAADALDAEGEGDAETDDHGDFDPDIDTNEGGGEEDGDIN